ncbi:ATP-binding protein [Halalkaliarchaeum sp. AArc-CO]|uniref:ATP-binding response regulator n=1 Tax=Halalkaliarchaeum sp. AArc-CO TaxID=2866381 RepID=UPI00217D16E4|nr:ATP-binding protein [Halalkaliarchaeum sp. AArc-CO]
MTSPVRVLYVGNDGEGRSVVERSLEGVDSEIEIREEPDAESALSRLVGGSGTVDCVVSAYHLPGIDGIEFRRELDRRSPAASVPFVLLVADGSEGIAAEALNAGVTGYVRRDAPGSVRRLEGCFRREVGSVRPTDDRDAVEPFGDCRAQLQWEQERIEEIRRVVSHDLRSPLNVAKGYLQHVSDGTGSLGESDGKHDESIRRAIAALDRLESFFDDLNALVRQGTPVENAEHLDLASVARSAWEETDDWARIDEGTESPGATLHTSGGLAELEAVVADPERLRGLFRELYQNAIEHGDPPVTIEIGVLPDGFYVADDGTGIPENRRDDVLEAGVSDRRKQTGFGLAAVRHIATAHGWELSVTESATGGARFELRGVTREGKSDGPGEPR